MNGNDSGVMDTNGRGDDSDRRGCDMAVTQAAPSNKVSDASGICHVKGHR